MKSRQLLSDLRAMEMQALDERLKEARTELFNLHFQAATGQLENHRQMRQVRRQIAQILTVMHGRHLGFEEVVVMDPVQARKRRAAAAAPVEAEAVPVAQPAEPVAETAVAVEEPPAVEAAPEPVVEAAPEPVAEVSEPAAETTPEEPKA